MEWMEQDSNGGVPASIAAAWGLRERPTKGPKRGLSLEKIVAAAVKVAGSDGIGAVSMSRVAADLGASTMALYRYVAAKEELLALMMDAPLGSPPELVEGEDWRAGLTRWAHAERKIMLANPWVLHIPISAQPVTPNQIAWLEGALRCLGDTALAGGEKMSVVLLVSGFVWREAMLTSDLIAAAKANDALARVPNSAYDSFLVSVIDEVRFPALSAVIAEGTMDQPWDVDGEFTFGLTRVLDGIEALVRSRAG
jgi:AcrR family transcriptional regulator